MKPTEFLREFDEKDSGEYNDEAGMAQSNLETIVRSAQELEKHIGQEENLPEWCQEKLAVVKGMLTAVTDYMVSQDSLNDKQDDFAFNTDRIAEQLNSMLEGGPYDLPGKDYDRPGDIKHKPRPHRAPQRPRHPDDPDFMDPDQRRLRADQARVKKAQDEYHAKKGVAEGVRTESAELAKQYGWAYNQGEYGASMTHPKHGRISLSSPITSRSGDTAVEREWTHNNASGVGDRSLAQHLQSLKEQGVAEASWNPVDHGDFPVNYDADTAQDAVGVGDASKWKAMTQYYSHHINVTRALDDLYRAIGRSYYDQGGRPVRFVAKFAHGEKDRKTETKYFDTKDAVYRYAQSYGRTVLSIEKVDTSDDDSGLIKLPVLLGVGTHKKKWILPFPDENYAQKWQFKHKNIADIQWPAGHALAESIGRAVNDKGLTQHQWLQLVQTKFPDAKIVQAKMIDGPCRATLPDGRTLSWTKVDQGTDGNNNSTGGVKPVGTGKFNPEFNKALQTGIDQRTAARDKMQANVATLPTYTKKGVAENIGGVGAFAALQHAKNLNKQPQPTAPAKKQSYTPRHDDHEETMGSDDNYDDEMAEGLLGNIFGAKPTHTAQSKLSDMRLADGTNTDFDIYQDPRTEAFVVVGKGAMANKIKPKGFEYFEDAMQYGWASSGKGGARSLSTWKDMAEKITPPGKDDMEQYRKDTADMAKAAIVNPPTKTKNTVNEFAGGMGASSVGSAPGVGKGPKVGSLFGGSYAPKTPFNKKRKQ